MYLPGNHDEFAAHSDLLQEPGFTVRHQHVHIGIDRQSNLVFHGDKFDLVEHRARWLSRVRRSFRVPHA